MKSKKMNCKLIGKVKSGLGEASFWTNKISKIFEEKEYILESTEDIIYPSEYNGNYNVLLQKCKIFESISYIVRPEINNKKGGTHPLNVIELVSDKNLRKTYNLKDTDKVEIELL